MRIREEPAYRQFEGTCRDCGCHVTYHNSVRKHRDNVRCESCEKAWIAGRLTGQKTIACPVTGQGGKE